MHATSATGGPRLLQFLRFCVVGAVGFIVDAGVLLIEVHAFHVDPIWGRLVSFAIAVLTTFEFNRRWAFKQRGARPYLMALASYLGVQGLGFACNFSLYTLLYLALPPGYNAPLFCLAIASLVALSVNYAGASLVVFRTKGAQASRLGRP
ncbi:MAG: GtrA family protein [Janthinobacterium lividum]